MKSAVFLYNTQSGKCKIERCTEAVCTVFRAYGYDIKPQLIDFCANPFDGNEQIDLMVVAGGDGTVNYVVNAMKNKGLDIPLGVIPAGTANDFAGALGMSHQPLEAARQIASGAVDRVDCGCVNGLYFVNIFSFGIFTTTSQRTPDQRKHKIGKLAYLIEGVKELRAMHAVPLKVVADGQAFDFNSLMVLVFNGETAGGFRLARRSSIKDGLFDCIMLEKKNFLRSTLAMGRYLLRGNPKIVRHLQVRSLDIVSTVNEPTDVDGQKGAEFPLHIECIAGGLRIMCPPRRVAPFQAFERRFKTVVSATAGLRTSLFFVRPIAISDENCYICPKNHDDMADNIKATRTTREGGRENLRKVSISRIKKEMSDVFYLSDDLVITTLDAQNNTTSDYPASIDGFSAIIMMTGEATVSIDMQNYNVKPNTIVFFNPDSIIRTVKCSSNAAAYFLAFSKSFVNEIQIDLSTSLPVYMRFGKAPVLEVTPQDVDQIRQLFQLIKTMLRSDKERYRHEIIRTLFTTAFYIITEINQREQPGEIKQGRCEVLFDEFMSLLQQYNKRERNVSFYAKQLNITPKYLSSVVKEVSGKTAACWIDESVILEAKALLKYSGMSIQEIAYHLNFSTQSFFGKYFKQHTGTSPSRYKRKG